GIQSRWCPGALWDWLISRLRHGRARRGSNSEAFAGSPRPGRDAVSRDAREERLLSGRDQDLAALRAHHAGIERGATDRGQVEIRVRSPRVTLLDRSRRAGAGQRRSILGETIVIIRTDI